MERKLYKLISDSESERLLEIAARIEQSADKLAVDIKYKCPKCKDAKMILIKDDRYGQCDCVKSSFKKGKEQPAVADMEKFQVWLNNKNAKIINDWHRDELDLLHRMPVSGVRGKKIVALYVERWRRLMEARMESLLEAHELYGKKLEREDVERFIDKMKQATENILKTYSDPSFELSTVASRMALPFNLIIQSVRNDLYIAMTRAALQKKKKKNKKLPASRSNVFNGPIHGGVQIDGENNTQIVSVDRDEG